jgi:hypothetical protein
MCRVPWHLESRITVLARVRNNLLEPGRSRRLSVLSYIISRCYVATTNGETEDMCAIAVVICRVCDSVKLLVPCSYELQGSVNLYQVKPLVQVQSHVTTGMRSGVGLNCWIGTHVTDNHVGFQMSVSHHRNK